MKRISFSILLFLIVILASGQENSALKMAIETEIFRGCFCFYTPEQHEIITIVDTGNYFKGFKYDTICGRSLKITNQLVEEKTINTIMVHYRLITFRHSIIDFFCPANDRLCSFIFERQRNEKGELIWKIIGTSTGSF